jgi:hypothetical protein
LQAAQIISGVLRLGRSSEDGTLVLFEDGEPICEIRGVVVPNFGRDTELSAKEGGTQLRYQFLEGVGFGTEPLPV